MASRSIIGSRVWRAINVGGNTVHSQSKNKPNHQRRGRCQKKSENSAERNPHEPSIYESLTMTARKDLRAPFSQRLASCEANANCEPSMPKKPSHMQTGLQSCCPLTKRAHPTMPWQHRQSRYNDTRILPRKKRIVLTSYRECYGEPSSHPMVRTKKTARAHHYAAAIRNAPHPRQRLRSFTPIAAAVMVNLGRPSRSRKGRLSW